MQRRQLEENYTAMGYAPEIKTTRQIPADADFGAYLAGLLAKESQDWPRALRYFERALEKDPENKDLQFSIYLMRVSSGEIEKALPLAQALVKEKQSELMPDYVLIIDHIQKKNYGDALAQLDKKPKHVLDFMLKPMVRTWILAGMGEREKALKELEKIKAKEPLISLYWYHRGLLGLFFKDDALADESFKKLNETGMPTSSAYAQMIPFYQNRNEWNVFNVLYNDFQALVFEKPFIGDLIGQMLKTKMNTAQSFLAEGLYNLAIPVQSSENIAALMLNSMALYLSPDHVMAVLFEAEIFEGMKMYERANYFYKTIPNPSDTVLLKQALSYRFLGKNDTALTILLKLAQNRPQDPLIYKLIGDIYQEQGNKAKGIEYYARAIKLVRSPQELSVLYLLRGNLYELQGQSKKAEADFLVALNLDIENPVLLNDIGYRWLEQDKNLPQAVSMVKKAYAVDPENPYYIDSMAMAFYKQKEYEKAVTYSERATDMLPYSAVVNMNLGDIYLALGRRREAGYQYQKALNLKTDLTPALEEALKKKITAID
jgi:tetratricopeptide (TPR) repeat protein